ncbi:MAG: hypothetical protein ACFB51_00445, partial [Anaerolineae bacterium]
MRADADLCMRLYRAGSLLLHAPESHLILQRAPSGGLRHYGQRRITYASSRQRLDHRHLPTPTEIRRMRRCFTPRQVREALLLRVLGTLVVHGGPLRRAAGALLGLLRLPDTLLRIRRAAADLRE